MTASTTHEGKVSAMLARVASHPSVVASAGAATVLVAASVVRPLPWPVWAVWAGLSVVAGWQAARS